MVNTVAYQNAGTIRKRVVAIAIGTADRNVAAIGRNCRACDLDSTGAVAILITDNIQVQSTARGSNAIVQQYVAVGP